MKGDGPDSEAFGGAYDAKTGPSPKQKGIIRYANISGDRFI